MLFTKLLLLIAAVATATPVAAPVEDDPHGLNLTLAEKELIKDPSAWKFDEITVDPVNTLASRQNHVVEHHRYQWGAFEVFDCPVLDGLRRDVIALLSIGTTDGRNNGANTAKWTSHENVDESRPSANQAFDFSTPKLDNTAYHFFCGTVLGSHRTPDSLLL